MLTPGTRIELYERPRYSKKLMAKGWFLVEQHTADKLLLKHETKNYRECLPMFDIRAGVYQLKHDGVWLQCRKNTNWKKVLDERDKQRAGTLDALPDDETDELIDENPPETPALPDETDERKATTMMKKEAIRKLLADGKTIEDLIPVYHPQYPEMSIRMLRTKLMAMTAERKPKQKKDKESHEQATVSTVAVNDEFVPVKAPEPMNSRYESKQEPNPVPCLPVVEPPKPRTYCLLHNDYHRTTASFIQSTAESNGYTLAAGNDHIDVCIMLLPLTSRGLVELGMHAARIRAFMVHPGDKVDSFTSELLKELTVEKDIFVFDNGKSLVEQLQFLGSIQH